MSATHQPSMETIAKLCAATFRVTMVDLMSERRDQAASRVRHLAMWMARRLTERSLPDIARYFQRADHTTVMNAIKRAEVYMDANPQIADQMAMMIDELTPARTVEVPAGSIPWPRLVYEMEGRRVRLAHEARTPNLILPRGTEGTITTAKNWQHMRFLSAPCGCCGVQTIVQNLRRNDVELVA